MNKFGLDKKGFRRARYKDVVDSMNLKAKELFGENINTSERSPLGIIIKITAFTVGNVWQLAEYIYYSAYKDTATGTSLDNVAEYIGIRRRNATYSTGKVTFEGINGTIVTEGTLVSRVDGIEFRTVKTGTISDTYLTLDVICTSRGSIGNSPIGTVIEIVNIIEGLNSVNNGTLIDGGLEIETDDELRKRYDISLSRVGSSTVESIRATLLDTENVTDVIVEENTSMSMKGSIPPKSIAPLVRGGLDADIAQSIFVTKAGGIQSYGTTEVEITDSMNIGHTIGFTRPVEVPINITLKLTTSTKYPLEGNEEVKEAITKYIGGIYETMEYLGLGLSEDVIYTKVISSIHNVVGITDIPVLTLNTLTTNVNINNDEVAVVGTITFVP